MASLKTAKACIEWKKDMPTYLRFVGSYGASVYPPSSQCSQADVDAMSLTDPTKTPCTSPGDVTLKMRIDHCKARLQAGDVDVWITQEPIANLAVLDDCEKYSLVPGIRFGGFTLGFAMIDSSTTRRLLTHINDVIRTLRLDPWYYSKLSTMWGIGKTCGSAEVSDLEPIQLEHMLGLFLMPVIANTIAVGLAFWRRGEDQASAEEIRRSGGDPNELPPVPDHTASEGELLRWLVKAMEKIREDQQSPMANSQMAAAIKDVDTSELHDEVFSRALQEDLSSLRKASAPRQSARASMVNG